MSAAAPLARVMAGSSAAMAGRLLDVLLPDAATVLDLTWGRGNFWRGTARRVTGVDISPHGHPAVVADFARLPFADGCYDVCVFDPPYFSEGGSRSLVRKRFGNYATQAELKRAVEAGCREAWRVARVGVIVKVMDYVHASRLVRMTRWAEDAMPAELYDVAYLTSPGKVEDPKWSRAGSQLSVRSNATAWLVWRKDGPVHRRRRFTEGA